ncbi:hypothetical protein TNCV_1518681 [Trichonephila clavipes]|nr:hypothetical protein TNCV_1518681 [Trichonephila clavipes]
MKLVGRTASLSEHVKLHSAGKMSNQHEVSCETKKLAMKTFQILTGACGDEILSRAHVFEGYKRFSGGRVSVEDDEPAGSSRSAITDQNIAIICYMSEFPLTSVVRLLIHTTVLKK